MLASAFFRNNKLRISRSLRTATGSRPFALSSACLSHALDRGLASIQAIRSSSVSSGSSLIDTFSSLVNGVDFVGVGHGPFGVREACLPGKAPGISPCHPAFMIQSEKMKPPIVEERPHVRMTIEDVGDGRVWSFDHDRQPERLVHQPIAVVNGLPWQSASQKPAITLDHSDAAGYVVGAACCPLRRPPAQSSIHNIVG
jgi:hypothetical protein